MERHQDIAFGVTGQSLYWDCPEGRPSSVTSATVFAMSTGDSGTTVGATTGSSSTDSVNTTVDAASGAGQANPRLVNVASTGNFVVGRTYLATTADGAKEWFEVVEIDSGNSVTARFPLMNAYASADTVQGTRISISVDSTWVATQSNLTDGPTPTPGYRVRWVYVVSSVTYVHDAYFDLVRYPSGHQVTAADLDEEYPGYVESLPTYHRQDQGRRLLDQAYEQVCWDLIDADIDDASVRDVDALNRAVVLQFGVRMAKANIHAGGGSLDALDVAVKDYQAFIDKVLRVVTKVKVSTDTGGGGHDKPSLGIWEK